MRKLLLVAPLFAFTMEANAQCTPDPSLIPDAFGVYPDATTGFPVAEQNVPYNEVLHFKAPTDAGDVDPTYTGVPIVGFAMESVDNLPPGLDYECGNTTCEYVGGSTGCASVFGTPTTIGIYPIDINIFVTIMILGNPVDIPQTFSNYQIVVVAEGTASLEKRYVNVFTLYPNPVINELIISDLSAEVEAVKILDINGRILESITNPQGNELKTNIESYESGVYFVEVRNATAVVRKRFVKA